MWPVSFFALLFGIVSAAATSQQQQKHSAPPPLPAYSHLWLTFRLLSPAARSALNITRLECDGGGGDIPAPLDRACAELATGLTIMLGVNVTAAASTPGRSITVRVSGPLTPLWPPQPAAEGYVIQVTTGGVVSVTAGSALGALAGAWRLLSLVQRESSALLTPGVAEASTPSAPLRMWNLWDNADGSIERGYAGTSILYPLPPLDPGRILTYARLLSSLGINAIVLDNVNACGAGNEKLLASSALAALAPSVAAFYSFGIHALLTPCWTSPQTVGGLATSDPRDARVSAWWDAKVLEARAVFPAGAFRGLLFKGDTEGQPGPADYNLTELEGANFMAARLAPADALCIWRAFSHPPGGRDMPVDQALYQFQRFADWDGATAPNVVLQTKNGPFDFQVREPVHALFGRLPRTNVIVELEVTLEYLGQNHHAVALAPQWASYFAFDLGMAPNTAQAASTPDTSQVATALDTTLAGVISRGTYSGVAGVSNLGNDASWAGSLFASSNTFAFGRLAWQPTLPPQAALEEWAALSFLGSAPGATDAVVAIANASWRAYEDFTASLGWGFASGGDHYHMDPAMRTDYTNATHERIGYARGAAGAYGSAYNGAAAAAFLSLDACPEELLLAFHNVPYTHLLRGAAYGGRSVLEWIYASHAAGAAASAGFASQWAALEGRLNVSAWAVGAHSEAGIFATEAARLQGGAADAAAFASVITQYFQQLTGVPPVSWPAIRGSGRPAGPIR